MLKFKSYYDLKIDSDGKEAIKDAYEYLLNEKEKQIVGYYDLPNSSQKLLKQIDDFTNSIKEIYKSVENIVIIGIGGSSLGIKAIDSMLKHKYKNVKNMLFLENPDPTSLDKTLSLIKKENSIFIVISKSGTSIETISIFKILLRYFKFDFSTIDSKRVVAISDKDSPLYKFAKENQIKTFIVPKNVGGRFSVLSAVGVVPLALAKYNMIDILKGAKEFLDNFFAKKEEHLIKKAYFYAKKHKQYPINVLFPYSDSLEDFTKWFIQLWAESLGKIDEKGNSVGLTPITHVGSVNQHSFLQLVMQGPKDKTVTFIKIEDFENALKIPNISLKHIEKTDFVNGYTLNELINAECDATKESLIAQDIPVDMITLDKLDENNIGQLIIYFEILTSFTATLLKINPYNQPGVEFGKRILKEKFVSKNSSLS